MTQIIFKDIFLCCKEKIWKKMKCQLYTGKKLWFPTVNKIFLIKRRRFWVRKYFFSSGIAAQHGGDIANDHPWYYRYFLHHDSVHTNSLLHFKIFMHFELVCMNEHHVRETIQFLNGNIMIWLFCMMTSSNGNIFRVTGPLCREFTGHRSIPLTKASDAELLCFLWSASEQTVE